VDLVDRRRPDVIGVSGMTPVCNATALISYRKINELSILQDAAIFFRVSPVNGVLVDRRRPDVIGVSGMTPETRRLYKLLSEIVDQKVVV
jgi:hypothetical protein